MKLPAPTRSSAASGANNKQLKVIMLSNCCMSSPTVTRSMSDYSKHRKPVGGRNFIPISLFALFLLAACCRVFIWPAGKQYTRWMAQQLH